LGATEKSGSASAAEETVDQARSMESEEDVELGLEAIDDERGNEEPAKEEPTCDRRGVWCAEEEEAAREIVELGEKPRVGMQNMMLSVGLQR